MGIGICKTSVHMLKDLFKLGMSCEIQGRGEGLTQFGPELFWYIMKFIDTIDLCIEIIHQIHISVY